MLDAWLPLLRWLAREDLRCQQVLGWSTSSEFVAQMRLPGGKCSCFGVVADGSAVDPHCPTHGVPGGES